VVFETAGSPVTIAQTPFIVRRGGTITLVGISAKEEINYNFAQIMDKEATIKSVFRYRNIYPKAIAAVSSGAIYLKSGCCTETGYLYNSWIFCKNRSIVMIALDYTEKRADRIVPYLSPRERLAESR
jgi:hypothetical protein